MRSGTSFFNKTIFMKNVRRFWPLWTIYLIILLLFIPVNLANSYRYSVDPSGMSSAFSVIRNAQSFCMVLIPIFSGISALSVFSYLYNSKSAGMMASLPIKRGAMFFTNYISGLVWACAANLIVFLAAAAAGASYGMPVIEALLGWLGINTLLVLFYYGLACFCAVLTGSIVTMPPLYAVINFTAVAVELTVDEILNICLYGISLSGNLVLKFLSPVVMLWDKKVSLIDTATGAIVNTWALSSKDYTGIKVFFEGAGAYAVYAAVGIVFAVLAGMIFRRRHMETASDVVAVKPLRPLFRYCMTFGCALVLGVVLYSTAFPRMSAEKEAIYLTLLMVTGGFIGYFASEMMMQKSFRVFRGRWRGFIISALIIVVLMTAVDTDIFGLEKYVPGAESIESIDIFADDEMRIIQPGNIKKTLELHRSLINNKKLYETAQDNGIKELMNEGESYGSQRVSLEYMLKSGRVVTRTYIIPVSDRLLKEPGSDANLLDSIVNSEEAIKARKSTAVAINEKNIYSAGIFGISKDGRQIDTELSKNQALELYDCILKDMDEGTIGRIWLYGGREYETTVFDANISFDLTELIGDAKYVSDRFWTVPTKNSNWTNGYLKTLGIEFMTIAESNGRIQEEKFG